jgi:hypothetical protein
MFHFHNKNPSIHPFIKEEQKFIIRVIAKIENWENDSLRLSTLCSKMLITMAQHRTKKDKVNAQTHRMENMKMYSLQEIDTAAKNYTSSVPKKNNTISEKEAFQLKFVKIDLTRTLLSTITILVLLAVGVHFL